MSMMRRLGMKLAAVVLALGLASASSAEAAVFGIYSDNAGAAVAVDNMVTGMGHTGTVLAGLGAANLVGIDVLWILNSSNGGYDAQMSGNVAAIAAFVSGGGVLSFHDRRVVEAATIIPGAAGVAFTRDVAGANPGSRGIDVEPTAPGLITNGPGGVINNATLDNGTESNHGWAAEGTLPAGAIAVFNTGVSDHIVDFYYAFGAGWVYYSTIPLDFYMGGGNNFADIYAKNEAALQASLVPEPVSLLLLGTGGIGLAARMRRRKK